MDGELNLTHAQHRFLICSYVKNSIATTRKQVTTAQGGIVACLLLPFVCTLLSFYLLFKILWLSWPERVGIWSDAV